MNFIGSGRRLAAGDFARVAARLGCSEAALRAVVHVEARGEGFDAKARPVILPERHVFYRCLSGEARQRAVNQGLAWSAWQPGKYPATQDGRYEQLQRMMAIDAESGLKAASWGLGQVLGENHAMCGFATARALVERCVESEGGQLDVMAAFIAGAGLSDELRRGDWAGFARGYNGPRYRENAYDDKLARAFRRFSTEQPAEYDPLADGLLSLGDKGQVVRALQLAIGIHADGDFGPMTEQRVRAFQADHGLTIDGKVGKLTGRALGLAFWG